MASPVVQQRETKKTKRGKKNDKKITRIGSGFNKPCGSGVVSRSLKLNTVQLFCDLTGVVSACS